MADEAAVSAAIRRVFQHVRGNDPTELELARLVRCELRARARYGTELAAGCAKSVHPGAGSESPAPTIRRSAETWLDENELKEAESIRLFAQQHGVQSVITAVEWYARHRPAALAAPNVATCAVEFQTVKRCEGLREASLYSYSTELTSFARTFGERQVITLSPTEIGDYLRQWENLATRTHHWSVLSTFFDWAQRMGYTVENVVRRAMRKPRLVRAERYVLTPAEARSLLAAAKHTELIVYWAMALFSGIRTAEYLAVGRLPDPWSLVRLGPGIIDLPATVTKTAPRLIPISPTLRAWLRWARQSKAPFAPRNFWTKIRPMRAAVVAQRIAPDAAGAPCKRFRSGEPLTNNIARRSYISYRLALAGGSYAEVADEVGNYEEVIRKHYFRKVSRQDANKYFALTPAVVGSARAPTPPKRLKGLGA